MDSGYEFVWSLRLLLGTLLFSTRNVASVGCHHLIKQVVYGITYMPFGGW